jgi:hypothetical protein
MTQATNPKSRNPRALVGTALLMLGFLLLFGKLGLLAAELPQFLASSGADSLGVPAAVSLSLMKLFRAIAFHPSALSPLVCGILVLSVAWMGIFSGLILLRKRTVETAR